jgi:hypothetical protein
MAYVHRLVADRGGFSQAMLNDPRSTNMTRFHLIQLHGPDA